MSIIGNYIGRRVLIGLMFLKLCLRNKKKGVYFLRLGWNVLIIVKIIWGLSKNCKVYDLNNGFFYNIIKFLCLYDLYR